jgi:hypothetical protein
MLYREIIAVCSEIYCCILRGIGGKHIVDIVPGGTELELQLRQGVGQAANTHSWAGRKHSQ